MGKPYWIYGKHACDAALQNPNRTIRDIMVMRNTMEDYDMCSSHIKPQIVEGKQIARVVPKDAIHQGIAVLADPLPAPYIDEIIDSEKPIIILDQVTDPHNVGAVMRSAAAFDAAAVIMHDRNSPSESGTLAKSASGALELVPLLYVSNIANAIASCQQEGYWCVGLDGEADIMFHEAKLTQKTVLVLGAEGKGMRSLTTKRCDALVKLPMHPQMESLNVSNAAAIALYDLYVRG